ncbi:protein kinase domain-containing protein [Lyngbya aestuarii]|uniref:protein kinase domain-containing protein n=1 Tax=Lyngbya aestuarii TaxID=118322 RepID=UPI00403DE4DE
MSYCLNSNCPKPQNPEESKFCLACGTELLLKNRYRALKPRGLGGCSRTFKALDQERKHPCAIKLFLLSPEQDQEATELFKQEALQLYELGKHEQIPEFYAHFEQNHRLYLVQEFIDGLNLREEIEQQGTKSESQIREMLVDLLPVLQFIHQQGVIHRDIKPANIMRRRSDGKFVLIDFGVAKRITATVLLGKETMIGTLGYAPAEQLESGNAYPNSDLYALGATCIHLLTGKHPFELYNPIKGCINWRENLPQKQKISPKLGKILDKLIQPFTKDRYQSANQVLEDLNQPEIAPKITFPVIIPYSASVRYPTQSVLGKLLISKRGVDCTRLRNLIAARKRTEEKTHKKILAVLRQKRQGYLNNENSKKFSYQKLHTLSRRWTRFGLKTFAE